jgi:hypothetical protein
MPTIVDIVNTIEHLKHLTGHNLNFIAGGDFNINLLHDDNEIATEFLNSINLLALHPVISIPTRVTNTSTSLIDNFSCDLSKLPAKTNVITTDVSDHYIIALHVQNVTKTNTVSRRNFSIENKAIFSTKLMVGNWTHLYSITDVDMAYSYFIKN